MLVDFVNNELRGEFQPGIMQPLSPVMTSGLEVMPGKEEEIYLQYLDALANAKHPGIKKYLQEAFGYTEGGLPELISAIGFKAPVPMARNVGFQCKPRMGRRLWMCRHIRCILNHRS